jgi:membrane-associated protease RseP (regulator of RpoE activity)
MGSGGQVSTALDMWRWVQAVFGGKILSPASLRRYGDGQGILAGGDVYGFQIVYAGDNRACMIIMSNTGSPNRMRQWRALEEGFSALVLQRQPSKYTLGLQLEIDDNDRVKIRAVAPGGVAARAGLLAGDVLTKIGGKKLGSKPLEVLGAALATGQPVEIEFQRGDRLDKVTVKPASTKRDS